MNVMVYVNMCSDLLLQMICSCAFLFALRRWKLISFGGGESLSISDKSTTFVPLKTLIHTLPLAVTYLLYMVLSPHI